MSGLPVRLRGLVLPDGREWLVLVPHGWARGADLLRTARAACDRAAFCKVTPARGPLAVLHVHPGSTVDGMGSVCWDSEWSGDPCEDPRRPVEVARWADGGG